MPPTHSRRIRWRRVALCLVATLLLAPGSPSEAAKFNRVLDIGHPAPAWTDLPAVTGPPSGLADFKDARLLVVVFTRNLCPIAQKYAPRLHRLAQAYRPRGVQFVALNVSRLPGESLADMQARQQTHPSPFPYLKDVSQRIGRQYGAVVTPHVFVLDERRRIAYMGASDDHVEPEQVTRHYLRDALDALLARQPVDIPETLPKGCSIDYPE